MKKHITLTARQEGKTLYWNRVKDCLCKSNPDKLVMAMVNAMPQLFTTPKGNSVCYGTYKRWCKEHKIIQDSYDPLPTREECIIAGRRGGGYARAMARRIVKHIENAENIGPVQVITQRIIDKHLKLKSH